MIGKYMTYQELLRKFTNERNIKELQRELTKEYRELAIFIFK